jgi:hypothetical protein
MPCLGRVVDSRARESATEFGITYPWTHLRMRKGLAVEPKGAVDSARAEGPVSLVASVKDNANLVQHREDPAGPSAAGSGQGLGLASSQAAAGQEPAKQPAGGSKRDSDPGVGHPQLLIPMIYSHECRNIMLFSWLSI